ncbi:MAG TPA: 4-(cytidine 5'-diphospho)-2-C-methyl-D-erythritol kinase [Chlamydiales bacterium]|nr:4-(cytidine 5'-diphospho)-2-C-methyl-D-erythritol kinase [Chlamydiales bacterium]
MLHPKFRLFSSPAKINLFFHILGKRSDGYHEIASLYQAIDLFDTLKFRKGHQDFFSSNIYLDEAANLVLKALRLFRIRFPFSFGVKIHLEKRIPLQAGLGGGSSNAATTLWALNELTGRRASMSALIEMGALLGSDVPFFFSSGTSYCTGRGEILEPFHLPYLLSGYLAKPSFGLSTSLVYQETRIEELIARDPRQGLVQFPLFYNDLEPAAFRIEPRLRLFHSHLKQMGFDAVTMTGSGTAFMCQVNIPKGQILNHFGYKTLPQFQSFLPFRSIQRAENSWYIPLCTGQKINS